MKFAYMLLVGAASAAQIKSRSMLETSLVGLEAPNPVPSSHNLVAVNVDGQKFKTNKKQTTLTIVQDFPKKPTDGSAPHNLDLIQGKSSDVNFSDKHTTLTIV